MRAHARSSAFIDLYNLGLQIRPESRLAGRRPPLRAGTARYVPSHPKFLLPGSAPPSLINTDFLDGCSNFVVHTTVLTAITNQNTQEALQSSAITTTAYWFVLVLDTAMRMITDSKSRVHPAQFRIQTDFSSEAAPLNVKSITTDLSLWQLTRASMMCPRVSYIIEAVPSV